MKRWRLGLPTVLPLALLWVPGPAPSSLEVGCAALAVCLDAAAVNLPYFGLFSTAPALLAALAWRGQAWLVLGCALLGLSLRALVFRQFLACAWEMAARALFCRVLMQAATAWAVLPAALVAEGTLWLGAYLALGGRGLAQQKAFQKWVRFDRYVLPHRVVVYALAPLVWLISQAGPLYLVCLAPVLVGLHRAVQAEEIRLALREEEELIQQADQARQELTQVASKLTHTQHRLRFSQQKESAFWELSLQLVQCQTSQETARCSLDYLARRLGCHPCAFWERQDGQWHLLAGQPPEQLEALREDPTRTLLRLGELGLLFCQRAKPLEAEERELLSDLSGLFTLGLQSVRRLQEQERRLASLTQSSKIAALGQLAAGLAHELNSPLAAMRLQLGRLPQRAQSPEKLEQSVHSLNQCLDQAQGLIGKLLYYSRDGSQAGVTVDLNKVLADTLDLTQGVLAASQVELVGQLQPLQPIQGNASELQQAISNLVINAKEACVGGGRVEVYSLMQGNVRTILVRDNGRGLEPEVLERIFEPFFTTHGPGHAGLGLSVAQQIVGAHGGKLTASNRDGSSGADFLIEL
ncbi:MAG: ATP-binding protein [Vulcanimicrobiota bacterium]